MSYFVRCGGIISARSGMSGPIIRIKIIKTFSSLHIHVSLFPVDTSRGELMNIMLLFDALPTASYQRGLHSTLLHCSTSRPRLIFPTSLFFFSVLIEPFYGVCRYTIYRVCVPACVCIYMYGTEQISHPKIRLITVNVNWRDLRAVKTKRAPNSQVSTNGDARRTKRESHRERRRRIYKLLYGPMDMCMHANERCN